MNLNGKISNPGELRTLITIQARSVSTETGGFLTPEWSDVAEVWAKWVNAHGAEAWTAASLQAEMPATVTLRYREDIDQSCALLKGANRFEIVSMDNIQERGEYIELKVKRMRSG